MLAFCVWFPDTRVSCTQHLDCDHVFDISLFTISFESSSFLFQCFFFSNLHCFQSKLFFFLWCGNINRNTETNKICHLHVTNHVGNKNLFFSSYIYVRFHLFVCIICPFIRIPSDDVIIPIFHIFTPLIHILLFHTFTPSSNILPIHICVDCIHINVAYK